MPSTAHRWELYDPVETVTYTFEINPNEMDPITSERNIRTSTTTAVGGKVLVSEGNATPPEWTFSGTLLSKSQYLAMEAWAKKNYRVVLTDHFERTFQVLFRRFEPVPRRSIQYPWRHDYTMRALILSTPTAPA